MRVEITISEAIQIINEHFENRGYFINYDDVPITCEPYKAFSGVPYRFIGNIALTKSEPFDSLEKEGQNEMV